MRQFFKAGGPQGHFFRKYKQKNNDIRCAHGEYVYHISGLYSFSFGQGLSHIQTEKRTYIRANIGIPSAHTRVT